jgi:hypothetical protein
LNSINLHSPPRNRCAEPAVRIGELAEAGAHIENSFWNSIM